MFYVKTIGETLAQLVGFSNINKHILALGSHLDYDAQGWGCRADRARFGLPMLSTLQILVTPVCIFLNNSSKV